MNHHTDKNAEGTVPRARNGWWPIVGVAVVGVAVGLAVTIGGGRGQSPREALATTTRAAAEEEYRVEVELTEVQRTDVASVLELTGNLLPRRRTIIVAEVDGVIKSIPGGGEPIEVEIGGRRYSERMGLDLGVPVSQGDVLVEIEPRDFQLELEVAQAQLLKAQMDLQELMSWRRTEEVRRLKAQRDEALAKLDRARAERQRAGRLAPRNVITQSEYDQIEAEYKAARATLEVAEAELAMAEAGPTEAQIAVLRAMIDQAEAMVKIKTEELEKTVIRAPYDAVITERFVDEGERVTAQPRVEIMEIVDLSLGIVQVGIPERYLGRIQVGDLVTVKAEGVRDPVPGLVVLVNQKVDPETRTFRVRAAVENHERIFKAGQFAHVRFNVASASGTLAVPPRALSYSGGQAHVFVYEDGRVRMRPVETGLSGTQWTEVRDGLNEGEQVVVDDPSILADGMLVRPKTVAVDALTQSAPGADRSS